MKVTKQEGIFEDSVVLKWGYTIHLEELRRSRSPAEMADYIAEMARLCIYEAIMELRE